MAETSDTLIDAFFDAHLANRAQAADDNYFPVSRSEGSAFIDATRSKITLDDLRAVENKGAFGFLADYWKTEGRTEFTPMIDDLKAISEAVQTELAQEADTDGELSSFVYAMY